MTSFTLPISPGYVADWGLWEAIRELYQNALDQRATDPECRVSLWFDEERVLHIGTSTGELTPQSLILGNTTKANAEGQRGKFGEGYKLAMLVLCRMGHRMSVLNGATDLWVPRIEMDDQFGCEVLKVQVGRHGTPGWSGVEYRICGIVESDWEAIKKNIMPISARDEVLEDPEEKGRVYVGGLYVATLKDFRFGYALAPGRIKLDRDRGMVRDFDLTAVTSKLWSGRPEDPRVLELLEQQAPDVAHMQYSASKESPSTQAVKAQFVAKHGDATPVSTQEQVLRAQEAGVRWALVPEPLRRIIGKTTSLHIPTTRRPIERLASLFERCKYSLSEEDRGELEDIIKAMGGGV